MIETILKAVKSNNKKRGRNITIGAVVGMLLSCTAVMGADGPLYIKENDSGEIEFSTDGNTFGENPYSENSWDEPSMTYTNNRTLSEDMFSRDHGISGDFSSIGISLTNTGKITGLETGYTSTGLYSTGEIINLINTGEISADGNDSRGIDVLKIQHLINTGKISVVGSGAGAITTREESTKLINIGEISVDNKGKSGYSTGVEGTIMEFINNGKILNIGGQNNEAVYIEGLKLLNTGEISSNDADEISIGISNEGTVITNTGKISAGDASYRSSGINDNSYS